MIGGGARGTLTPDWAKVSVLGSTDQRAAATIGRKGTLELATIIGDYAMAAVMLNATDQRVPPGRPELLPGK